jgi:hypothetical protein
MTPRQIILTSLAVIALSATVAAAEAAPSNTSGLSFSIDGGIAALGGIGARVQWWHSRAFVGAGFSRFPSSPEFGGYGKEFDLMVDHIISAEAGWYFLRHRPGKNGLYSAMVFHLKEQQVTEKASGAAVRLPSLLLGLEAGFEFNFWGPLFITPRVGALYYLVSPQGPSGDPVPVGTSYYDNPTHKVWDLYYTLSIGANWYF